MMLKRYTGLQMWDKVVQDIASDSWDYKFILHLPQVNTLQ